MTGTAKPLRLIACLDVKDGRVVKGIQFEGLQDQGDPIVLADRHAAEGADEIVLLDIAGTDASRQATVAVVSQLAARLTVPVSAGGGLRTLDQMANLLEAGARRVIISSAAVVAPDLIRAAADRFGSDRLVVAIDAKRADGAGPQADADGRIPAGAEGGGAPGQAGAGTDAASPTWAVYIHGGKTVTGLDAVDWCRQVAQLGAGEILLTSIDRDGTAQGFDLPLLTAAATAAGRHGVPIIASGGAGNLAHLAAAFRAGTGAVLAASIFHQGLVPLRAAKAYLRAAGIPVQAPPLQPIDPNWLDQIRFDDKGLVPVVVVPAGSDGAPAGPPLMLGWSDRAALASCMTTGLLWFWSRSRQQPWQKGETSGHVQLVRRLVPDCDHDSVMATVTSFGPMCHTGAATCFHGEPWSTGIGWAGSEPAGIDPSGSESAATPTELKADHAPPAPPPGLAGSVSAPAGSDWSGQLARLYNTICERLHTRPEGSYVARLAAAGDERIRQKVGEEAVEVIVASNPTDLVAEMADLWFHSLMLLAYRGIDPAAVGEELARRERPRPGS